MAANVIDIARGSGKGRQPAHVELVRDLQDEVRALTDERDAIASEVAALSRRVQLAVHADRPDVALHVAGRLDALAASLTRRGNAA